MKSDIFERYEKKYILTPKQYDAFLKETKHLITQDVFPESTISNIYFDTPDYRLIRTSLEKPAYKEKLRLRSYKNCPAPQDEVFVELKKKYRGIVYKRRVPMTYQEAQAWLLDNRRPQHMTQIHKEIDYMLQYYQDLSPAMFLYYDRTSYKMKEQSDVRITFDHHLRFRDDYLHLYDGTFGDDLLPEGYIMEIKIPSAFPIILADILNRLEIYPGSFSKYGKAYQSIHVTKLKEAQ